MLTVILGGSGNVGHEFVRLYHALGISVVVPKRDELGADSSFESVLQYLKIIKPKIVINCAAMLGLDDCEANQAQAYAVNAALPLRLAIACQEINARLIQISTDSVFSGSNPDEVYLENSCPLPTTVYGLSKLLGEVAAKNCRLWTVIRLPLIYGRTRGGTLIVDKLLKKLAHDGAVKVADDVLNTPVYIPVAVRWIQDYVINSDIYYNQTIHIFSNRRISLYDFFSEVASMGNLNGTIVPVNSESFSAKVKKPKYGGLSSIFHAGLDHENMIADYINSLGE